MYHPGHLLHRHDEGQAVSGCRQLRGGRDGFHHAADDVGGHQCQHHFLFRLDLDAEHALLLVATDAAAEQHGAAMGTGLHAGLQHAFSPSLAHDADDEARVLHGHDNSFGRVLCWTMTPTTSRDMTGASAISATSPKPFTSGLPAPVADEAPSASASRNELASGPVATPPASAAMGTKSLLLKAISTSTTA